MFIDHSSEKQWYQIPPLVGSMMQFLPPPALLSARTVCKMWKDASTLYLLQIKDGQKTSQKAFDTIQKVILFHKFIKVDQQEKLTPISVRRNSIEEDFHDHLRSLSQKIIHYLIAIPSFELTLRQGPRGFLSAYPIPENAKRCVDNIFLSLDIPHNNTLAVLTEITMQSTNKDLEFIEVFVQLLNAYKFQEALLAAEFISDPNKRKSLCEQVKSNPDYNSPRIRIDDFHRFHQKLLTSGFPIRAEQPQIFENSSYMTDCEINRIFKSYYSSIANSIFPEKTRPFLEHINVHEKAKNQFINQFKTTHEILANRLGILIELYWRKLASDNYYQNRALEMIKNKEYALAALFAEQISPSQEMQWRELAFCRIILNCLMDNKIQLARSLQKHVKIYKLQISSAFHNHGHTFDAIRLLKQSEVDNSSTCKIIAESLIEKKKFRTAYEVSKLATETQVCQHIQLLILKACCKENRFDIALDILRLEGVLDTYTDDIFNQDRFQMYYDEIKSTLSQDSDIIPLLQGIRNPKLRLHIATEHMSQILSYVVREEYEKAFVIAKLVPDLPQDFLKQSMQVLILQQNYERLMTIFQEYGYMNSKTKVLLFDHNNKHHMWFFDCLDEAAKTIKADPSLDDRLSKISNSDLERLLRERL